MKYVVISESGGQCSPDTVFDKRKEAEQYARLLVQDYRDGFAEYEEGIWGPVYEVHGNPRDGYRVNSLMDKRLNVYIYIDEVDDDWEGNYVD